MACHEIDREKQRRSEAVEDEPLNTLDFRVLETAIARRIQRAEVLLSGSLCAFLDTKAPPIEPEAAHPPAQCVRVDA